jgi:predicted dienelactone hydrolase
VFVAGAAVAALVTAGGALSPDAAPAAVDPAAAAAALPVPVGGPVGVTSLHLVDRSRTDPWTHAGRRHIAVSAFYPARRATTTPASHVSAKLGAAFDAGFGLAPGSFAAFRTHAGENAAPKPGRHPIAVLDPGFNTPRSSLTVAAEDLAARGWIALVTDHPGETFAVEIDGRVRPADAGVNAAGIVGVQRIRVADIRHVLDALPALDRRGPLRGLLDRERVAMIGHSLGGSTAASAMLSDRRVDAGINLDGSIFGPATRRATDRPFMSMTSVTDATQRSLLRRLRGPGLIAHVAGSGHYSFTDYEFMAPLLAPESSALAELFQIGTIPAAEQHAAQRAYVHDFLDHHVLGRPASSLLSRRTTPRHPSVSVRIGRHGAA